jgi:hypothetical protein
LPSAVWAKKFGIFKKIIIFASTTKFMPTKILKEKIHKAIDQIDNNHLLEVVFSLVNKNNRFNEFELSEPHFSCDSRKVEINCASSKSYTFTEVKKKILENLEK